MFGGSWRLAAGAGVAGAGVAFCFARLGADIDPYSSPPTAAAAAVPRFARTLQERSARRALAAEPDPIVGLVLGNAIGDAFGFGIEFEDAYIIRETVTRFDEFPQKCPEHMGKFKGMTAPGMYSDDAEMSVGLMKALSRGGIAIHKGEMLEAWREEWDLAKQRPQPAAVTRWKGGERVGHGSVKNYFRGDSTLESLRQYQADGAKRGKPVGNAPPMRALGIGFVSDAAERARLSRENADATHPHPEARAASLVIASACQHLVVQRGEREAVIRTALAEVSAPVPGQACLLAG